MNKHSQKAKIHERLDKTNTKINHIKFNKENSNNCFTYIDNNKEYVHNLSEQNKHKQINCK